MPPRCAGNAGMGSKVDASGSSSMGDVFQWFRPGDGSWGQRTVRAHEKVEAYLSVGGLPSGVSEDEIKRHFTAFYSTVKRVSMIKPGTAQVLFGYAGERDKAFMEMQGRPLKGCPLQLSRYTPPDQVQIAGAKRGRGPISDAEIQRLLLERQKARSQRDYRRADAYAAELKQHGVLLDLQSSSWRSADGRTGYIPHNAPPSGGRSTATPVDDRLTLYVNLQGEESMGTHTLKKILAPFNVEDVKSTMDGYVMVTFADHGNAAKALSLSHYSPIGNRLNVLSPKHYREATGKEEPAAGPSMGMQNNVQLPVGWSCGWSSQYGCYYYCNPSMGLTQWEPPPAPPKALVEYSDEEDEKETEGMPTKADATEKASWFYGDVSGTVHGPYPQNVISGWVAIGSLLPTTPVCKVGEDDFALLKDTELVEILPAHLKPKHDEDTNGGARSLDVSGKNDAATEGARQIAEDAKMSKPDEQRKELPEEPPKEVEGLVQGTPPVDAKEQEHVGGAAEVEETPAETAQETLAPAETEQTSQKVSAGSVSHSRSTLSKLKVPELRAMLKDRGLDVDGKKQDLINRLLV